MNYKGFYINDCKEIYRNGVEMFPGLIPFTVDHAKQIIDQYINDVARMNKPSEKYFTPIGNMSYWERYQMEKYGKCLKEHTSIFQQTSDEATDLPLFESKDHIEGLTIIQD